MAGPVGIYISVPFCKAKCTFCNFASGVFGCRADAALCGSPLRGDSASESSGGELGASSAAGGGYALFWRGNAKPVVGGAVPADIRALRGEFELASDAEITLECAPGQLADETLDELLRQGMNRISFGVQSFVDRESAAVGRLHTRQQCEAEIARVRAAGVHEINLDLIAGLPHQTEQSWRYSVEQAIAQRCAACQRLHAGGR